MEQTLPKSTERAQDLFQKAIALDPRFARAYAGLSFIYTNRFLLNIAPLEDKDNLSKAFDYAKNSIRYDKHESFGYLSLGRSLWLKKEHGQAIEILDQGLQYNHNHSRSLLLKGQVAAFSGRDVLAEKTIGYFLRLSPFDPTSFSIKGARCFSFIHQKKYDKALDWGLRGSSNSNAYFTIYSVTAACLELTGNSTQAQQYAAKVLELQPNYSVESYWRLVPHADKATSTVIANAMLRAGIPKVSTQ